MGIEEISMVRNRCTAKCQKGAERARQKHALRYKYNKQAQSANFSKLSLKKKKRIAQTFDRIEKFRYFEISYLG